MLDIRHIKQGQYIVVRFFIDQTRPEWVMFSPEIYPSIGSIVDAGSSTWSDRSVNIFNDSTSPVLHSKQPVNYSEAAFSTAFAYSFLSSRGILTQESPGKPRLIQGNRTSVIKVLVSIYPVLFLAFYYEEQHCKEKPKTDLCIAGHDAMIRFVNEYLVETTAGRLNAHMEIVSNG